MATGAAQLIELVTEEWGERCPDFDPCCLDCQMWAAVDGLAARCPDLSEADIDMAMHWLGRFLTGLDARPQLDRIGPAAALKERT